MNIRVEEKSLQLALVKAAGQLGITQDELAYKVVEKSAGFLGMFGKKVAIEAWKRSNRRAARGAKAGARSSYEGAGHQAAGHQGRKAAPAQEQQDRRSLSKKEVQELQESLRTFCEGLCQHITDDLEGVSVELQDERLIFDIKSAYLASQIAKNTKLAESLEHVLRKKPHHLRQEIPFRVFVDVQGVRRARENELVDMAQDLSNKVHENKRPIVLNYRSSYDRKIIHMALDKDNRVYTKSIGSGPNRKLMILPMKENSQEVNA